jgi:hypothetical protein
LQQSIQVQPVHSGSFVLVIDSDDELGKRHSLLLVLIMNNTRVSQIKVAGFHKQLRRSEKLKQTAGETRISDVDQARSS